MLKAKVGTKSIACTMTDNLVSIEKMKSYMNYDGIENLMVGYKYFLTWLCTTQVISILEIIVSMY